MNQKTIPNNNLPVYLQRYDVDILDDKKESVGNVLYTTTGVIPSNQKEKRVWSLNLTGYLKPNVDKYNITYDFSEVDYKYKEEITFENIISGTFTICGRVLDASKIVGFDYKYNDKESTLTIELDTSKWDFRLKKEVLFSYNLNVDDPFSTNTCPSSVTPSKYCTDITIGDYTQLNTSSTTSATLTLTSANKLYYDYTNCQFDKYGAKGTAYSVYLVIESNSNNTYFTISSLYGLYCCKTISCGNGTYCDNASSNVQYDNSNGIEIPSDGESATTVVSLKNDGIEETFATFSLLMYDLCL